MSAFGVLAFLAAAGIGIYKAAQKGATAEDLRISVDGVKFDPAKDVTKKEAKFRVVVGIGNARGGSLKLDVVDIDLLVDGKSLGRVRDYKADLKIAPAAYQTKEFTAMVPILALARVLGTNGIKLVTAYITAPSGDRMKAVKAALPNKVQAKGVIRAEGMAINIDQEVPIL